MPCFGLSSKSRTQDFCYRLFYDTIYDRYVTLFYHDFRAMHGFTIQEMKRNFSNDCQRMVMIFSPEKDSSKNAISIAVNLASNSLCYATTTNKVAHQK